MDKVADIIVPTYNRYDQLSEFFRNNERLKNGPVHFWIVDDCSSKPVKAVLPVWENLTFIQLPVNKGQTFARNVAIEKGGAPYIISLDDDAWFEDGRASIELIIKLFETYPDAGCLMFNIATPANDYSSVKTGTLLPLHITCGCVYRRTVLEKINGFSGFLHSGGEETDLSLRLYQAGYSIRFASEIKVFHNFNPAKRPLAWYYNVRHNTTRNDLLIVMMYYPLLYVPVFVSGKYVSHLLFAVKNRIAILQTLWNTVKAFLSFVMLIPQAIRRRKALSLSQFGHWRRLQKQ